MISIIRSRLRQFSQLTIFIVLGQLLLIYASTINALVLNELIAMNWSMFLKLSIYQLIVWCGIIFFDWLVKNYQVEVIQEFDIEIRDRIAKDISNSTYQEFHSKSSGTYLSWLNNDIQSINKQAFEQLFLVIKGISGTIFAVITLSHYHWSLTVITFFALLIMLSIPKFFGKRMQEVSLTLTKQNEEFLKSNETILNGFDVFASLNLLRILPDKVKEASILLKQVTKRKTAIETFVGAISFFLNIFFQISLVVFTGYLAIIGIVKIGTIEAIGALTGVIFTSLGELGGQLASINGTKPIFAKLDSINVAEISDRSSEKDIIKNSTIPLYEAKNVGYSYGERPVLKNLTFCFERNKKYLIMGESGSGKSTLLKLLNGFLRDYTGELFFGGREIRELAYSEIVSEVLLLDQKAYLFDGTIRDNIVLDEEFTDEEILQVLEQVGLIINDCSDLFLDYYVGDDGRLLSGGQKQRIALARGLIRDKKIVLIDEGTSAVDKKTSLEIERKILEQNDLTVIMITHTPHPELAHYFDEIYQFPQELM
ncbi:ATP-binding cassette domain-containing protein [Streptococcus mitis]|uniref:ATP-binding cassette domain-containing protein n=1 Tax=Streptococcus mitis TaxID=28037 RepID=UPI0019315998|nr:ABC transporter ATP-binding protein [Streptococcus mitis]